MISWYIHLPVHTPVVLFVYRLHTFTSEDKRAVGAAVFVMGKVLDKMEPHDHHQVN